MAGQFEALPRQCSPELGALIRRLLIVDTKQRPSCTDILQTSAVQSRMHLLPKVDNEGYGGHGGDDEFYFTKATQTTSQREIRVLTLSVLWSGGPSAYDHDPEEAKRHAQVPAEGPIL